MTGSSNIELTPARVLFFFAEAKTKEPEEMEESDRDTDGETKQAGTLDVSNSH